MYNNSSLVNDTLNMWKQKIMQEQMAADTKEQYEDQQLSEIVKLMSAHKARKEQMAQQAQQFAEQLGFQKERGIAEDKYRNSRLQMELQKLAMKTAGAGVGTGGSKADMAFDKKMSENEAGRVDEMLLSARKLNLDQELQQIYDAEEALRHIDTGPEWLKGISNTLQEGSGYGGEKMSKAYSDLKVLSGEAWIKKMQQIVGNLSTQESGDVRGFTFGLGLNNQTNKKLLNALENGFLRVDMFREFSNQFENHHGNLRGVDKAWSNFINSSEGKEELKQRKEAKREQMGLMPKTEQKKNESESVIPEQISNNKSSSRLEEELKIPKQLGAGFAQPFLDIGYGVAGKKAPQIVPEEEQGLAYNVGDIGGNFLGWTGAARTLGAKALGKYGVKSESIRDILAAVGIETAKNYDDRLKGGAIGAVEGIAGNLVGKAANTVVKPVVDYGKKVLTKGAKKKELAGLAEEEGKLASEVYDKVLGKYELRANPSVATPQKVRDEFEKVEEIFKEKYNKLFKKVKEDDFRLPKSELNELSLEYINKRGYGDISKLTLKGMHKLLSGLKKESRKIDKNINESTATIDFKKDLLKQDIDKLNNILNEKIPGYKELTKEYAEQVAPYISTAVLRNIKRGKNPDNFATNLSKEKDASLKSLYNVLPKEIKETAAAGEFLQGTNVMEKSPRDISQLYRDLMKKGSQNTRETIEGQIGKETAEQLNKVSVEIRNITEELQQLNAINPNEDITKLVNYLSNGQVQKVSGIVEKLLETPLGTGAIKLLERLQQALNIAGKVTTPALLSIDKTNDAIEE